MVIVIVTFVLDIVFSGSGYPRLGVVGRGLRILRIVRGIYLIYQQRKHLAVASRRIISQNKRRYVKDGFDLDLCYITERMIAMSFPSSGVQSMYRNNIREVSRFFETKHKGHYKLYNLCNPENVVAIHCKGGKGRTGTMICTWLVECGNFEEAQDSLDYFGDRRTDLDHGSTFQGVETPSQSRYVGYFGVVKNKLNGSLPKAKYLKTNIPAVYDNCAFYFWFHTAFVDDCY
ncbi:TPTE2-like protein [Mya arenaria]|uniref:TPTE2-like protein n=1 Tax=Mya arenaria TaxID=6604 RepID=A0ABY7DQI6_MYAAR|nr:TPTE2-like protein [Mya arenaria]